MSLIVDDPELKPSPVVFVQWVDSQRFDGWATVEELRTLATRPEETFCWTVGFLLAENEGRIVVASTEDADRRALSPVAIPRVAIVALTYLEEVKLTWNRT